MSHTPGPWTLDHRMENLTGSNGQRVTVYGAGLSFAGLPTQEYRANARLIAQSPELLRLLERHHAAWVARERLTPKYAILYTGTELALETEAAIERAKEKV